MPTDIGIIDLMLEIPSSEIADWYSFMAPLLLDRESRELLEMPAGYLFKDIPKAGQRDDYVGYTLEQMDRHGIERAMITIRADDASPTTALREHEDRFIGSVVVDPNRAMDAVRDLRRAVVDLGAKAATVFPAGCVPQVPINDKKMFPLYAACVELDVPIFVCAGMPGPRIPMACQHVELLDEVCWFFPELRLVTRHGCEPWTDLMVALMRKYPNLYYSTSAFAPKRYPKAIIDFANGRGGDRILYAGYFPMGLSLDRIFSEMPGVPLADDVWPRFLRTNAERVLKL